MVFSAVISALAVQAQGPTGDCQAQPQSQFIGDRSSCTFTRLVDRDSSRIPSEIPTVSCRCPDSLCSLLGDFRCREVTETFPVKYKRGRQPRYRSGTVNVTIACVCAMNRSIRSPYENIRVGDTGPSKEEYLRWKDLTRGRAAGQVLA
uniref:Interleukin-17 n=1 Tax=Ixodes ricinus TaxID=34613 RepID=A0A147BH77_IXORI